MSAETCARCGGTVRRVLGHSSHVCPKPPPAVFDGPDRPRSAADVAADLRRAAGEVAEGHLDLLIEAADAIVAAGEALAVAAELEAAASGKPLGAARQRLDALLRRAAVELRK